MLENKFVNYNNCEQEEVISTLASRQVAGTSPVVKEYEEALSQKFNTKHALAVSSGTAALHLLMYVYGIRSGDEVIAPASAPVMSVLPIMAVGAKIVFVDNEADSFGFDIHDLKKKINSRTKMVIAVPMWGYAVNARAIKKVADANNIPFIEDASHCHGSTYSDGAPIGTVGNVGFFSTQERKLIATGEGGFMLTDDDKIADRIREVRDFGKPVSELSDFPDRINEYGHLFGLNFRISGLSAALGKAQITKLDGKIIARKNNAKRILSATKNSSFNEMSIMSGSEPNYYTLLLTLKNNMSNEVVGESLYNDGIVSDTYRFKIAPLYEMPLFSPYKSHCPNTEELLSRAVTIPVHEGLTDDNLAHIIKSIKETTNE